MSQLILILVSPRILNTVLFLSDAASIITFDSCVWCRAWRTQITGIISRRWLYRLRHISLLIFLHLLVRDDRRLRHFFVLPLFLL